jgi:hypothetical protein
VGSTGDDYSLQLVDPGRIEGYVRRWSIPTGGSKQNQPPVRVRLHLVPWATTSTEPPTNSTEPATSGSQPSTTTTEVALDPVEGVWDFNRVDGAGAVTQELGLLQFKSGRVTLVEGSWDWTPTYQVVESPDATSVEVELSGVSPEDGKPVRTLWHCTVQAEKTVLGGWVEADMVTVSGSGSDRNVHRSHGLQKLLWGVLGTRVSDWHPAGQGA